MRLLRVRETTERQEADDDSDDENPAGGAASAGAGRRRCGLGVAVDGARAHVARLREPAHQHPGARLLLRHRVVRVCSWSSYPPLSVLVTGAVPAMKPEATAIRAPQDGRWKMTVSFDGLRFCVPKFRH